MCILYMYYILYILYIIYIIYIIYIYYIYVIYIYIHITYLFVWYNYYTCVFVEQSGTAQTTWHWFPNAGKSCVESGQLAAKHRIHITHWVQTPKYSNMHICWALELHLTPQYSQHLGSHLRYLSHKKWPVWFVLLTAYHVIL